MRTLRLSIVTMLIAISFLFVRTIQIKAESPDSDNSVEQNAIKMTIETYFESRYRSLSTLQLESFESLTDKSSEGAIFLRSESDKLEVEIQHAKLNHLGYARYDFFLDFNDISIDTINQMAAVSVIEGHDVVFEISEEISKTQPIVSSMRNLQHTITLKKDGDGWKIISDEYDDYLWRMIKATGLSNEELLQSMAESQGQAYGNYEPKASNACSLPSDESIHAYTRNGAVAYARQWALSRNPNYFDFGQPGYGGDCTNFVSQAIHEGGSAPMVIYTDCGDNCIGTLGWFYTDVNHRADAWNNVTPLYDFITQYWVWSGGPEGCDVAQYQAYEGDLIQYDWENDDEWDHSVIIVRSLDIGPYNRYHWVSSHTPDVDDYPFSSFDYPNKVYRFIHIERIDGYAMVYLPLVIKNESRISYQVITQNPYPAPMENNTPLQPLPYPAP